VSERQRAVAFGLLPAFSCFGPSGWACQPQCAGDLVLSSRRGLQPARPVLSGQGFAGGRAKRALDRAGSVWLPPGALRGENQPGPCLSEAVPGAGQSPAGVPGQRPGYIGPGGSRRRDARRWAGSGERGAGPGRLVAVGRGCHVGWVVALLLSPSPFLIPTGRAPRGKATPEGAPALPLLRAPGRVGIRRRGEQQSRGMCWLWLLR